LRKEERTRLTKLSQDQLFSHLERLQHVAAYRWIFDELAEEIDVTELGQQNIAQPYTLSHLN
jgi:hypothetical protein